MVYHIIIIYEKYQFLSLLFSSNMDPFGIAAAFIFICFLKYICFEKILI